MGIEVDPLSEIKILIEGLNSQELESLHSTIHAAIGLTSEALSTKQILLLENETGVFTLDPTTGDILLNFKPVGHLTRRRLQLFMPLAENPDIPMDNMSLMKAGWPDQTLDPSYVLRSGNPLFRVTISGIREALEQASPDFRGRLRTVIGFGYVWTNPLKPLPEK